MDADGTRLLCIIVPCFDEEQVVRATHAELKRVLAGLPRWRHLIYFVDDGSRDGTLDELKSLERADDRVRVLSLSRNFGQQVAITAGLDHADRRADAVLVMDADLETPPALIPSLLEQLEGGHDVVLGTRQTGRVVGWWKRLLSRAFYALFNRLSEVPIAPAAPEFFVLSRRAREALAKLGDRRRFLRAMVAWIGFSRAHVPYVPPARAAGRSKYTFGRMLRLAADALFAFSFAPLRLVGVGGGLLSALGLGLLTRAYLAAPDPGLSSLPGWMCLLSGLNLLALGIVGGYVTRIFEHAQGRPLYILREAPELGSRADSRAATELSSEAKVLEVTSRPSRRASRMP